MLHPITPLAVKVNPSLSQQHQADDDGISLLSPFSLSSLTRTIARQKLDDAVLLPHSISLAIKEVVSTHTVPVVYNGLSRCLDC